MKFCPVVPEICRGQVHGPQKERRKRRRRRGRRLIVSEIKGVKGWQKGPTPKMIYFFKF
jgi:hypothetical protein